MLQIYTITKFSDPGTLTLLPKDVSSSSVCFSSESTRQYSTPDGYEIIQRLKRLRARGGGDCPENALDGTLAGKTTKTWSRTGLVFRTSIHLKWYINKSFFTLSTRKYVSSRFYCVCMLMTGVRRALSCKRPRNVTSPTNIYSRGRAVLSVEVNSSNLRIYYSISSIAALF